MPPPRFYKWTKVKICNSNTFEYMKALLMQSVLNKYGAAFVVK